MGYSLPIGALVRSGEERATLIRRTYALVFASVLVTIGGVALGMSQPALMQATAAHPIISFLIVLAPLMLATRVDAMFPANIGLVFLFNVVMGVVISPLIYLYGRNDPGLIPEAAILTASTFGVLTIYAFVSRRDFRAWGGFFTIGLWVLIGTSLLNLWFQNATAELWIAAGTVLVFGGLLIFRTWMIRNVYGPDDYVIAAVSLYLSLLNMFLAILELLGGGRRNQGGIA